jgi:hypothetical protein
LFGTLKSLQCFNGLLFIAKKQIIIYIIKNIYIGGLAAATLIRFPFSLPYVKSIKKKRFYSEQVNANDFFFLTKIDHKSLKV